MGPCGSFSPNVPNTITNARLVPSVTIDDQGYVILEKNVTYVIDAAVTDTTRIKPTGEVYPKFKIWNTLLQVNGGVNTIIGNTAYIYA